MPTSRLLKGRTRTATFTFRDGAGAPAAPAPAAGASDIGLRRRRARGPRAECDEAAAKAVLLKGPLELRTTYLGIGLASSKARRRSAPPSYEWTRRRTSCGGQLAADKLEYASSGADAGADALAPAATYLHATAAGERVPVIDLRRAEARAGRRVLLGALHLPAVAWADRSLEFPPRWSRFALVVSRRDAASVTRAALVAAHFGAPAEVVDADADLVDDAGSDAGTDADADAFAAASAASAAAAAAAFEAFLARAPPERVRVVGAPGVAAEDARHQPRLWRPSPLLEAALEQRGGWLADAAARAGAGAGVGAGAAAAAPLRVLDAGCGTARNAVFLALRLAGATVVAVDNRRAMIEKAAKFAARSGCGAGAVECVEADICAFINAALARRGDAAGVDADVGAVAGARTATDADPGAATTAEADTGAKAGADAELFDVALFIRFTHKAAFERLPRLLRRDALVAAEAFHTSAAHPSDRSQQLAEGELAELLSASGRAAVETVLERLASAEDGRPLLQSVCRVRRR
jgi:SAM-dependent methyltransferase